jgi:hypothetical protein
VEASATSLYDRLGGIYSIATVVDDFIDRIMVDDRLNANPRVDEAHHRVLPPGFKYLVTEMLAEAAGGPQSYTGAQWRRAIARCGYRRTSGARSWTTSTKRSTSSTCRSRNAPRSSPSSRARARTSSSNRPPSRDSRLEGPDGARLLTVAHACSRIANRTEEQRHGNGPARELGGTTLRCTAVLQSAAKRSRRFCGDA